MYMCSGAGCLIQMVADGSLFFFPEWLKHGNGFELLQVMLHLKEHTTNVLYLYVRNTYIGGKKTKTV